MSPDVISPFSDALAVANAPLFLLGGYLAGSIPFGYLLARVIAGKDVRDAGSGNIGATNVARVVGKKLGIVNLLLDALKGAIPVLLVGPLLLPGAHEQMLEAMVGLCAFLGHCFPVWLKFKGGKGVATGAGLTLAHMPVIFSIGFFAFALIFLLFKTVSLSSILAALVVLGAVLALKPLDAALIPFGLMFLILLLRHTSNIKRLLNREELKV
jgi:glycerol-3-phosphate acyltransferase PlsY